MLLKQTDMKVLEQFCNFNFQFSILLPNYMPNGERTNQTIVTEWSRSETGLLASFSIDIEVAAIF